MPVKRMRYEREHLQRIAAGDPLALRALYDMYYPRMARFVLRVTGDADAVPEVINDTWHTIWHEARGFKDDRNVAIWIFGIAWRRALRALAERSGAGPGNRASKGAADAVGADRERELVLAGLTAEQRAVVELTYFFGYTYGEIATILGCSETVVKRRLFDARQTLRDRLGSEFDD
jgi:RNA polymerase sigma factor (sigma-70 family)